jgi:hypothetical protein
MDPNGFQRISRKTKQALKHSGAGDFGLYRTTRLLPGHSDALNGRGARALGLA